jgi:hypothetical protein
VSKTLEDGLGRTLMMFGFKEIHNDDKNKEPKSQNHKKPAPKRFINGRQFGR